MQDRASGGTVRVLIASRAPEAVAGVEKLAAYSDLVSLVGFVRYPYELEEDLEALRPDLLLLHPDFASLDTANLVTALAVRQPELRVVVVLDPGTEPLRARIEEAGATIVAADAEDEDLVAAIQRAVGRTPPPLFNADAAPEPPPPLGEEPWAPAAPWPELAEPTGPPAPAPPVDPLLSEAPRPDWEMGLGWQPADLQPPPVEQPEAGWGTPAQPQWDQEAVFDPTQTPPAEGFAPPAGSFAPPEGSFVPPVETFAPPEGSFVPPEETLVAPEGSFVPPEEALVAPEGSFVPPEETYAPPDGAPLTEPPIPIAEPALPRPEVLPELQPAGAPPASPEPLPAPQPLPVQATSHVVPESDLIPSGEGVPVFHLDTAELEAAPALPPAPSPLVEAEPIQPVRPRPVRRTSGRADLVVVFSGKGGVGKSVIATNLAVALAREGGKVALVDLDLQFGDVAVMLHTENHPTAIDSLAPQGEQVEGEFIEEIMATGPEGVRALLAPASPEFADLVNTANLRAILRELAKTFDHVVVDTPAHLEERNLEAIEMADQIIVVSSFNLASIKDTKVTLKLLQSLGIPKERLCVVLNQTRARANFPRGEVEETLRFRVVTVLPFDPRVDECIDRGRPFLVAEPKSDLSRQFQVLVDHIMGRASAAAPVEAEHPRSRTNRRRFSLGRG